MALGGQVLLRGDTPGSLVREGREKDKDRERRERVCACARLGKQERGEGGGKGRRASSSLARALAPCSRTELPSGDRSLVGGCVRGSGVRAQRAANSRGERLELGVWPGGLPANPTRSLESGGVF